MRASTPVGAGRLVCALPRETQTNGVNANAKSKRVFISIVFKQKLMLATLSNGESHFWRVASGVSPDVEPGILPGGKLLEKGTSNPGRGTRPYTSGETPDATLNGNQSKRSSDRFVDLRFAVFIGAIQTEALVPTPNRPTNLVFSQDLAEIPEPIGAMLGFG